MELRDNRERAKWILNIFYIMMAMYVILIISDLMEYNLLQKEYFSTEEGDANDMRQGILAIVQVGMTVLAAVFFIMWFRRSYFNLHTLGGKPLVETEGWAAGAWFVPIVNLFRPYKIMEDIWVYTQEHINVPVPEPKTLIGVWWGSWILGGFVDQIAARMVLNATNIEDYQMSALLTMIGDGFSMVTLVLIVLIVRKVSEWEDRLYNQSFEMAIEDHLI